MTDPRTGLLDSLGRALTGDPRVSLAMLFGSHARGRARPDGDVDVGIVPCDPAQSLRDELALQAHVEASCGRPVDLVRLDRADPLLRWEVARHGVPIWARERRDLVRFVARAALEHADIEPIVARAGDLFRRRLLSSLGVRGSA